jgi:hypothetical protein
MKYGLIIGTAALGLVAVYAYQQATYVEVPVDSSQLTQQPAKIAAPIQQGMRAYIDPNTGEFVSEPPPGTEIAEEVPIGADEAIEEIKLPDGSVVVNVGDRFNIPLMATMDCDGKISQMHSNEISKASTECKESKGGVK